MSRIDELLAAIDWPETNECSSLSLDSGDVLLSCEGFEERALASLATLCSQSGSEFDVVMVSYLPTLDENRERQALEACELASIPMRKLTYDRESPDGGGAAAVEELKRSSGRAYVDISGMSRLLITQTMEALCSAEMFHRTSLLYWEPTDYAPIRSEVESQLEQDDVDPSGLMFVSSGVLGITAVPELSSVAMMGQSAHVIVFPSFNPRQLSMIHADVQGADYTVIHGKPIREEHAWRSEAIRRLNALALPNSDVVELSTLDYRETLRMLLKVYRTHSATRRIVLAPTGSKMQTVAAGLFRAFMRDVQVIYPTPQAYQRPRMYSTGCRQLYELNLEPFAGLRSRS